MPAQLAADRDAILLRYQNLGFENAAVDVKPSVTSDGTRTDLLFTVREGVQVLVDHVIIVGNARTSTETIEQELQLRAGDPLGREAVFESQRRLSALGLFRRVSVTGVGHGDERRRDLLVSVEEAAMTTVAYGGGLEGGRKIVQEANRQAGERFEFAPRASIEVARRNLFGKNRSATLFASGSLPLRVSGEPTAADRDQHRPSTESEGRTGSRASSTRKADAFVDVTFEQQIRSSFDFRRSSANVALARRFSSAVTVSGGYQIQRTVTFNRPLSLSDQSLIDRFFPKVRLSSFLASIAHDTRNDPVDASSGQLFSTDGQFAARAIGSEIGFVKSRFTAQMFRMLPRAHRMVFAGSVRLGLATGFPHPLKGPNDQVVVGPDGEPVLVDDLDSSTRFYAGGDTTIRGFALDAVGVKQDPPRQENVDTIDSKGFPLGGNAVLILNGELRVPVRGGLQVRRLPRRRQGVQARDDHRSGRAAAGGGLRHPLQVADWSDSLRSRLQALRAAILRRGESSSGSAHPP